LQAIFGSSPATKKLLALVDRLAESDATVLITGESGSGKEVLAKLIHDQSSRQNRAFVPVNCGAIPRDLLESELFGHQKGSFTGAVSDRTGKIVAADGGTLFLDEIGDMPLDMQVKLLRVIQERKVDPVGSNVSVEVDVRIVAATHRSIESEIDKGNFRADLYYRLNVVPLQLPPLRERKEDIPLFIARFQENFARDKKLATTLKKDLMDITMQYEWPGNVRELSNFVQRLAVLYPGQSIGVVDIDPVMLPQGIQHLVEQKQEQDGGSLELNFGEDDFATNSYEEIVLAARGINLAEVKEVSLKETLGRIETDLIRRTLEEVNGNVSMCARLLKMRRTTLIERMKKLELA
jgi:sigma-54 specific flagellar transcriptional regulator A